MEQYTPYFSGSVPNDPAAADRLGRMYESGTQARLREIEDRMKLGKATIANSYKEALLRSGDARAAIEESREYHRGSLEQARQEMERIGIPDMEIRRFVAEHNYEIAKGELGVKQQLAQTDAAYKQGTLQQQRDEMLQMGIPKVMVDRFVAESTAAYQRGQLALTRDQMEQIGIPAMLTDRYSAESQSAYQQGQLGLTAQQQQQNAIEQQRRYALDVAKYGTELSSQPDRYFQAQQFASQAPRLLGLQAGAGPTGGPTPGINQMGNLLAQATEGLQHRADPYQLPTFPTAPGYTPPPVSRQPDFPTMPGYNPPPLGPMPAFPEGRDQDRLRRLQGGIPGHAAGGWVGLQGPELGWLGERGPEYVVPNGAIPGGQYTPWTPPGGWQPGDFEMRQMITDPGWAPPQGTPFQARMRAEQGGGMQTGVYHLPGYGQPGGGGALGAYDQMMGRINGPAGGGQFLAPELGRAPEPDLSGLAPDEQARYRQLMARNAQILASGGPGLEGPDVGELQRYQARVGQPRYPTGTATYGGPTAGAAPTYAGGGGTLYAGGQPGTATGSMDQRTKQLAQIAKASPPSVYEGLSDTDQATLKLMETLYRRGGQGIQGGEPERLGKAQQGFMKSAGSLLGYDYDDLMQSYKSYRPAQGSASLAG